MKDKMDHCNDAIPYHREFVKRQTGVYLDTNKGDCFANANLTVEDFDALTQSYMDKRDKQRIKAAEFLNSQGYDIEFDKDGFWLEEYGAFGEHKIKDILDLMIAFNKSQSLII